MPATTRLHVFSPLNNQTKQKHTNYAFEKSYTVHRLVPKYTSILCILCTGVGVGSTLCDLRRVDPTENRAGLILLPWQNLVKFL